MYGLKQIIMIDGHIAGKVTRINVSENANLSGTNGAGKTTILKLLPFFLGITPSELISKGSTKKPFVEYYLPRPSSYLVFEYERESGRVCAVVYRHSSGRTPSYRFLHAPFAIEQFSFIADGGKRRLFNNQEISGHWRSLGLEFTHRQIDTIMDYRAVIQNDRGLLARQQGLRAVAARYCMGDQKTHMQHMEKLVHATLGKDNKLTRIKLMLARIMEEEGISFPKITLHRENEESVLSISTLRDFQGQLPELRKVINQNSELNLSYAELGAIIGGLLIHEEQTQARLSELEAEFEEITQRILIENERYDGQTSELSAKRNDLKSRCNSLYNDIETLQAAADAWDEMGIEAIIADYAMLPFFETQAAQAKETLDSLLSEQQDLVQRFERLGEQAKRDHQRQAADMDGELAIQREQLHHAKSDYEDERTEEFQNHSKHLSQLAANQRPERDAAMLKLNAAQAEYDNPPLSEEERLSLELAEAAVERAELALEHQAPQLDSLKNRYEQAISARENAESERQQSANVRSDIEKQYREQLALHSPDDKSLLSVLREQQPDWAQSIGRVINPELLQRRDLHPTKTSGDNHHLLGWDLKLDAIEIPSYAQSQAELQQNLDALKRRVESAKKDEEACENGLQKANKLVQEADSAFQEGRHTQQNLARQLKAAKDARDRERQQQRDIRVNRKLLAEQSLNDAKAAFASVEERQAEQLRVFNEQHHEALANLQSNFAQSKSRLDLAIDQIRLRRKECDSQLADLLKRNKQDMARALRDEGVDEKRVEEASAAAKSSQAFCLELKAKRNDIDSYKEWKTHKLPNMAGYNTALRDAEAQLQEVNDSLERARADHNRALKLNRAEQTRIEEARRHARDLLERLRQQLQQTGRASMAKTPSTASADMLLHEAAELLKLQQQLIKSIQAGIRNAERILSKSPNSDIAILWERLCSQAWDESGLLADSDDAWRQKPKVIEHLLDDALPQMKRSLLASFQNMGDQLADIYAGLGRIRSSIKTESRRVSRAIDNNLRFSALSNIEVKLSSRVELQEYWDALAAFQRSWVNWQLERSGELPPAHVADAMMDAIMGLRQSRISDSLESLFDLEISITENGQCATVRNEAQMEDFSSTGLMYLALCSIFVGLMRELCPNREVLIHWPLDELGTLAHENVDLLFTMLRENGVMILGGFPSSDPQLLKHFTYKHVIEQGKPLIELDLAEDKLDVLSKAALEAAQ